MTPLDRIIEDMNASGLRSVDRFAREIVGQTIIQILATDHRHAVYTTFDKAAVEGATQRIVDSVKNYWNFK